VDQQTSVVELWDLSQAPCWKDPFVIPVDRVYDLTNSQQVLQVILDNDFLFVLGHKTLRWDLDIARLRNTAADVTGRLLTPTERLKYLEGIPVVGESPRSENCGEITRAKKQAPARRLPEFDFQRTLANTKVQAGHTLK
jgi:hypothetical protein